jgi:hypothetical protein
MITRARFVKRGLVWAESTTIRSATLPFPPGFFLCELQLIDQANAASAARVTQVDVQTELFLSAGRSTATRFRTMSQTSTGIVYDKYNELYLACGVMVNPASGFGLAALRGSFGLTPFYDAELAHPAATDVARSPLRDYRELGSFTVALTRGADGAGSRTVDLLLTVWASPPCNDTVSPSTVQWNG